LKNTLLSIFLSPDIKSLKFGNFPPIKDKFCLVFTPGILSIFILIFNFLNLLISFSAFNFIKE